MDLCKDISSIPDWLCSEGALILLSRAASQGIVPRLLFVISPS